MNLFPSHRSFGFFIGSGRIHIVEALRGLAGVQIRRAWAVDYERQTSGDLSSSMEHVTQALDAALEKTDIKGSAVSFALSGREMIVRYFEMPVLPRNERKKAAYYEAQKYAPLDIRDLCLDFQFFVPRRERIMKTVLFAAKKSAVTPLMDFFIRRGAKSLALEPSPQSLIRFYHHSKPQAKTQETIGFADIHADGSGNVFIAKNGTLLMARDFALSEPNNPSADPLDFDAFVTEARLSFNYFSKHFKDAGVKRLVLYRDTSPGSSGWEQRLQSTLNLPVSAGETPGVQVKPGPSQAGHAIAVGLALRALFYRQGQTPNLIPKDTVADQRLSEAPKIPWEKEKALLQKGIFLEMAALAAIILLIHLALVMKTASEAKKLDRLMTSHARPLSVSDPSVSLEELNQHEQGLAAKLALLTWLVQKRIYWTNKMSKIAEMTPQNIRVTLIDYSDTEDARGESELSFRLSGNVLGVEQGNEIAAINQLVGNLKKDAELMRGITDFKISSVKKVTLDSFPAMSFTLYGSTAKPSRDE